MYVIIEWTRGVGNVKVGQVKILFQKLRRLVINLKSRDLLNL